MNIRKQIGGEIMVNGQEFLNALDSRAKAFAPAARATFEANRELDSWLLDPLAQWAHAAYGDRAFEAAAGGYAKYCLEVWKAQKLYEKNGRYVPEPLPTLRSEVYENEGWMFPYMWATILIYPLWPSMVRHLALYRQSFLRELPSGASVLELASGHGVLGLMAAQTRPDISVKGFDISPPAVAVANRLRCASGLSENVTFEVKDALELSPSESCGTYQGIIAAMLAEHLSDPRPLFEVLARHLAKDGIVFFSTALESAQRDHTFEFHRESEPLRMAEEVGLRVTELLSDAGSPIEGGRFLPRALAMILRWR